MSDTEVHDYARAFILGRIRGQDDEIRRCLPDHLSPEDVSAVIRLVEDANVRNMWAAEKVGPELGAGRTERTYEPDGGYNELTEPVRAAQPSVEHAITPAGQIRRELAIATIPHITIKGSPIGFLTDLAAWIDGNPDDLEDACAERCPNAEQHGPVVVENMRAQLAEAHAAAAMAEGRLEKIIEAARIHVRMDGKMDPAAVLDVLGVEPWSEPYRPSALIPRPAGYSQTLRIDDQRAMVHEPDLNRAELIAEDGRPYRFVDKPVVTAQDPGGLLSEAAEAGPKSGGTWIDEDVPAVGYWPAPERDLSSVVPIEPLHPGGHPGFATDPRQETPDAR